MLWIGIAFDLNAYKLHGIAAVAIILFVRGRNIPISWLRSRIIKYIAEISFTIYLVHYFVLKQLLHLQIPEMLLMLMVFVLTILFACIINVTIERPIKRWGNRLLSL